MKISVVTVCHNSEKTIAYTVRSFVEQSHSDKELLVIDGGSTDRTLQIVRSFGDSLIRIISEKDDGIYDAMNKGLAAYTGDAVGFLNSDDMFHDSSVLARIASGLDDADAVYGDIVFVSDQAKKQTLRVWKAGPYRHSSFRWGWMPPHPTFYLRRQLAEAVGPFEPQYGSASDYDYMLRAMVLKRPRVRYLPYTLVDFMQGGISTNGLHRYLQGNFQCLKSRRKHLHAPLVDLALVLKPLRKVGQFLTP